MDRPPGCHDKRRQRRAAIHLRRRHGDNHTHHHSLSHSLNHGDSHGNGDAHPTQTATSAPSTGWIINEIHADPDPDFGDANGDGTVDSDDDEFVEIVNATGVLADIGGWTLADAVQIRFTFPAGTVLAPGCAVVVFGGGRPPAISAARQCSPRPVWG
ncbi:MAG: lamin tail domain-containing protein [Caldilineaceae bacterium]